MSHERVLWRKRHSFPAPKLVQRNPYFEHKRPEDAKKRSYLLWFVLFILILVGSVATVFAAPFFRVDYVIVSGNDFIRTESVLAATDGFLEQQTLGFIPNNRTVFLSAKRIEDRIRRAIEEQQALEDLDVSVRLPSALFVTVTERVPHAVYWNGGLRYLIDRQGVLTTILPEERRADSQFPTLYDQTTRTIAVKENVLAPELLNFVFSLHKGLKTFTPELSIDAFYIPPVTCPAIFETPQGVGETDESEEKKKTEEEEPTDGNKNINSGSRSKTTNSSTDSANTNVSRETLEPPPCDKAKEVLATREIRAKVTEGWSIYFRTDESLEHQLRRLSLILADQKPDRSALQYIDLRFGERIIVQ